MNNQKNKVFKGKRFITAFTDFDPVIGIIPMDREILHNIYGLN